MADHPGTTQRTRLTGLDSAAIYGTAALLVAVGASTVVDHRASEAYSAREIESPATLFQRVAGVRVAWLGLAVLTLHRAREHRALGWLLLLMALNPVSDTVLGALAGGGRRSLSHLPGALVTASLGAHLLRRSQAPAASRR